MLTCLLLTGLHLWWVLVLLTILPYTNEAVIPAFRENWLLIIGDGTKEYFQLVRFFWRVASSWTIELHVLIYTVQLHYGRAVALVRVERWFIQCGPRCRIGICLFQCIYFLNISMYASPSVFINEQCMFTYGKYSFCYFMATLKILR